MISITFKLLRNQRLGAMVIALLAMFISPSVALGVCLDGFVRDRSGAPVVGGDLDFDNAFTGLRLFTPGDNTDINGQYSVCVVQGIYHVSYAPPLRSHLVGRRILNVSLFVDKLFDVTLDSGVVISGIVTDAAGLPIQGVVNIDVDSLGAGRVYTPAGKTDSITGAYWIVVPAHNKYRLRFKPPPGMRLQVGQFDSLSIQSDTVINISLVPGIVFSGSATDESGSPTPLIKISFKRTSDGIKIPLANNKTDSLGAFQIISPPGEYAIQFAPPSGIPLIGVELDSFMLAADTSVNVLMTQGVMITVAVSDIDGAPLENADIDVTRESDSLRLFTPNDKTDVNGNSTVVVAPDTYEIKIDPPLGLRLDKVVLRNVSVSDDLSLAIVLNPLNRVAITGRVVDRSGTGISGVVIGALLLPAGVPGSVKRPLTDSAGFFDAAVPIGAIDILFSPLRGSRFVGKRFAGELLEQDSAFGLITLETGVIIRAHVITPQGVPASGYDIGLISSGIELFTPHDTVNTRGELVITAPPGVYDISVVPPSGFQGDSLTLSNVSINKDTLVTLILGINSALTPETFVLLQNYPNPFNGVTRMPYLLNVKSRIALTVHNVLGQVVRRFDFGEQIPGYYLPEWRGVDDNGSAVASGVYFYRLHASDTELARKMLFIQ